MNPTMSLVRSGATVVFEFNLKDFIRMPDGGVQIVAAGEDPSNNCVLSLNPDALSRIKEIN